jgi:hypothetical protein
MRLARFDTMVLVLAILAGTVSCENGDDGGESDAGYASCPGYVADESCTAGWVCPPMTEWSCGHEVANCLGGRVLVTHLGPCDDAGAGASD